MAASIMGAVIFMPFNDFAGILHEIYATFTGIHITLAV
jgi:hypothetical protein